MVTTEDTENTEILRKELAAKERKERKENGIVTSVLRTEKVARHER